MQTNIFLWTLVYRNLPAIAFVSILPKAFFLWRKYEHQETAAAFSVFHFHWDKHNATDLVWLSVLSTHIFYMSWKVLLWRLFFCVRCLPNDWDDLHLDKRPAAFCGGPTWVIQPGTVRPGRTDCVKRDCKVHHRYRHNTLSLWHQHFCCKYLEIYSIQLFTCLGSIRFLKEASYALQGCIYLISNTIVKYYYNLK